MAANRYEARETWLARAMQKLRPYFSAHGYEIPEKVRVSCGLPSSRAFGAKKRAIGEAWASTASRDKHFEIFISPTIERALEVLAVLVHELVHVTVGLKCGHKGAFRTCARAVGLDGPLTGTTPGETLAARLNEIAELLGRYPHGSLDKMTNEKKKQGTRLIAVDCPGCCYKMRITMTWLLVAVPTCPNKDCTAFGEQMHVDLPDDHPEED